MAMSTQPIYLDYAAATPVDKTVLQAMQPYFSEQFYNPSALYEPALQVHKGIEAARAKVAYWLGARPSEIIFSAGGTEANNLAIHGLMRQYPEGNIVIGAIEHESVLAPARRYGCREVRVHPDGSLDYEDLQQQIDDRTVLVSIMYANNEVGTIQPIREASRLVATVRRQRADRGNRLPLYLHTDACQAANYLDLHVARLGVDLLTLNGGKIYGPKQSGALYVKGGLSLLPLIDGGGQERGLRNGTENVPAIVGLASALDIAQTQRQTEARRLQRLQADFIKQLEVAIPGVVINGSRHKRLPNNVHIAIPGTDNERLLVQLDQVGIMAAAGSACSATKEAASHVLAAMGISEAAARSCLRLTSGRYTTAQQLTQVVHSLSKLLA